MQEASIAALPGYELLGVLDRAGAQAGVEQLRGLAEPPTAVLSSNARATMALVPALRGSGMALVGFGDFPMADMLDPAITVIDQDPVALGTDAAQRVFDRLNHPARRFRRRMVRPVGLIERTSCHFHA